MVQITISCIINQDEQFKPEYKRLVPVLQYVKYSIYTSTH